MRTTEEVWKHHCIAFANADINEVMADFADDAIYVTTGKIVSGKEGIRALYGGHFETKQPGDKSAIISETILGEIILFEWTAETATIRIRDGVDTFVVRDGLIVAQTMRCTVENK